jgi:hypothetical protein
MGMAASQARFLGLTARKTNIEYEGQQINQQRTALGNQTANYYNQMLGMKVPVPPAIDDYTKTIYSFEDGSLKNTITSLIAGQGGNYTVSYLRQWVDDFAVVAAPPSIVNRVETTANLTHLTASPTASTATNGSYVEIYDAATGTTTKKSVVNGAWETPAPVANPQLPAAAGSYIIIYDASSGKSTKADRTATGTAGVPSANTAGVTLTSSQGNQVTSTVGGTTPVVNSSKFMIGTNELRKLGNTPSQAQILADPYLSSLCPDGVLPNDKITKLIQQEQMQMTQLDTAYGPSALGWAVRYTQNTTTGAYEPQFFNLDVLTSENTIYDGTTGQSQSHIQAYRVGSQQKNEEIKGVNARLEQDATGRIINITLNPNTPEQVTHALTTNTVADQMRYDDAINQYEYDKYQYDQAIQEINAKIQIIQTQDKNLELRLKQLDTEQNAIQTEMDAVSKVIQKNVESTFKTFG